MCCLLRCNVEGAKGMAAAPTVLPLGRQQESSIQPEICLFLLSTDLISSYYPPSSAISAYPERGKEPPASFADTQVVTSAVRRSQNS